MIKSCYIHIPFCTNICSYCDFCKLLVEDIWVNEYLDALEKEIENTYQNEELETIYIGGGTPSCLSLDELERLLKILAVFKKSDNIEYTIEGNFESTTREKLELYKKYGINRLSFGLETIHSNLLKILHREVDTKRVEEIITVARELGFSNINLDLMYALPTETKEDLKRDLDFLLSFDIEHISTYSLILEDHTLLKIKNIQPIDSDVDYEMYQMICEILKKNHYLHYEISNFSKKGYESKHNTTYWNNEEYYGFGLGASSYIGNERIENTRSFQQYRLGNVRKNQEILNKNDKVEYEVILNLRKREGISLAMFREKYQQDLKDFYDYEPLVEEKFLLKRGNHLFIPEDKWYISNEIIVRLLEREV